jgi:hypothetical protein
MQQAIDYFNYKYWDNNYAISGPLTNTECSDLNYYRTRWTVLSGLDFDDEDLQISREDYDNFFTQWGNVLGSICRRLDING